ncbi:MAG: hypothetical protein QM708_06735 [Propioniciclava sp.]|uniref:hypothetical protein n=1 Tax=Propioniciclava sp. TaxID=2038686 RepID=UPI0039E68CEE
MTDLDDAGVVLYASHTHLFPGAKLRGPHLDAQGTEVPVLIVFSDASCADAVLAASGDGCDLSVAPYRTAGGTEIGAKAWILGAVSGEWSYTVAAKAS